MNEIKISIELRIEAPSESAARQYASVHGINVNGGKWYPNHGGDGGRLYATSTTPFLRDITPDQESFRSSISG